MKTHIPVMKSFALAVTLVALLVAGAIWQVRRVRANAPPEPDHTTFGMVGITRGQTIRLNVVNLVTLSDRQVPPDPCRVVLSFRNAEGQAIRNSEGQIIRRTVELQAGESAFLDLNGGMFGGPPTNANSAALRVQLRPFVRVVAAPPDPERQFPPDPCRASAEVFDNATLQTSIVMAGVESMGVPEGHNHNETLVRDLQDRER
jgi:xanthosine utilization system XapX-like protein